MTARVVGIDASNLRDGGGRTHLIELLGHADDLGGFDRVVVWGSRATLDLLPARPWLEAVHEPLLDGVMPRRIYWQHVKLPRLARQVDLLFAPGGVTTPRVRPRVVMSRNMLPFDDERRKFDGYIRVRLEILRTVQARSFASADGVIFLTDYARATVTAAMSRPPRRAATIPHGVGDRFRMAPRPVADRGGVLRLLYVSTVSVYKYQLELCDAVAALRRELPVELTLIGPDDGTDQVSPLRARIAQLDPGRDFLHYRGAVPFAEVHRAYQDCDIFVFPSGCENMPNILVEAMSSGLPIACSSRGPMPEVLGDAGVYFEPADRTMLMGAIRMLARDPTSRAAFAKRAYERAAAFKWRDCAAKTLMFLSEVAVGGRAGTSER